jgi:signal transduction histidine kinase/branched-subunit amino acid ABC-type transport system permease component
MLSGHPQLLRLAQLLGRPVAIIWGLAAIALGLAFALLGLPRVGYADVISSGAIAALLVAGNMAAVELEDGTTLTPAPALLIAGLTIVGWPLLPLAALIGTLAAGALRRRAFEPTLTDAAIRILMVALIAPIYWLTQPTQGIPYSTSTALVGLICIGATAYTVKLMLGARGAEHEPVLQRWHRRFLAMRWYVLAMAPLGGLLGVLWTINPWLFLLGLAPLAVAQHLSGNEIALRRTTAELSKLAVQRESLASRLERLQALATAMIGTLDVPTMLEILCRRLAALLDAPAGWVVLLNENARPELSTRHNLPYSDDFSLTDPPAYLALLERGRVVLVTDERCQALAPSFAKDIAAGWSAVLCIPLLGEGDGVGATIPLLGAICLAFDRLRGLDADEQRVLSAFAHQAAVSVENARLFDALRHKQAELIQSSKLAAVGTFAAGIAHEFNNLLGSMLGYAELGYGAQDSDEKNHSLQVVIQACRRGRSITRGLLTFARRQEHRRDLADISSAIDETLQLVELDLQKAHIEVVRRIEPVPPTVCDLGQLSQVVLNLITNARDAMKPSGGTITIGLRERRGMIELSVSDTGSGIDPEIRDKIFEPFMTTKGALGGSQTPGTGLGLSVSYGIVQDHGGTIEVDSAPGRGTTMLVRLPVTSQAGVEHELAVSA